MVLSHIVWVETGNKNIIYNNEKLSGRKGLTKKLGYPGKTPAKMKMFDSSISPSGLLERLHMCF